MSRRLLLGFGLAVLAVAAMGVGIGTVTAQPTDCEPVEDKQVCIDEFDVPEELVAGEQGGFALTLTNYGNETATATLYLHTADPANETADYELEEITLDPDESTTVSRPINATTPGVHGMRISVIETDSRALFDISAIETIEVLEEHPKELGGPIDRTEIALGALIVSLLGIVYLGYRKVTT